MSELPANDRPTVLERWKALAEMIENRRAKRIGRETSGKNVPPGTSGDPEKNGVRERRDAQIEAWAANGMSTREISARTELNQTTTYRILRTRRLKTSAVSGFD